MIHLSSVATVLTVYGIETIIYCFFMEIIIRLQQSLPFTVLKLAACSAAFCFLKFVATVLTVYGIETFWPHQGEFVIPYLVATVLTVYGIETNKHV